MKVEDKNTSRLETISHKPESPSERVLRLGNDEVIAKAISDMLKRDGAEADMED